MDDKNTYVIGLMSGTSLDGVDVVYVRFAKDNYKDFTIIHATTIAYDVVWKTRLKNAIDFKEDALLLLDKEYGAFLGDLVVEFMKKYKIENVDFVASHGHTVLHQPAKGITLQVGNGQLIANITKQKVVCDFRTQDVKLGGEGAPLVPIGDALLFADYKYCLNLGGFSNISFKENGRRIAFDICPVNIVLNYYVNTLGFAYDDAGMIAASGTINKEILEKLNALDFYKKEPPKSLGLEWVKKEIFVLIDALETDVPTILRTFVEHVAYQISKIIGKEQSVLVTGGGAFNTFLMERIAFYTGVPIVLPSKQLIDFKEALLFAFLGLLKIDNQVNCLSSVTGAKKDHSSGVIYKS